MNTGDFSPSDHVNEADIKSTLRRLVENKMLTPDGKAIPTLDRWLPVRETQHILETARAIQATHSLASSLLTLNTGPLNAVIETVMSTRRFHEIIKHRSAINETYMADIVRIHADYTLLAKTQKALQDANYVSSLIRQTVTNLSTFQFPEIQSTFSRSLQEAKRIRADLMDLSQESLVLLEEQSQLHFGKATQGKSEQVTRRQVALASKSDLKALITAVAEDSDVLYQLDSRKFEELVAEALKIIGYSVELTKQTRDGGRDIIATKEDFGGRKIVQVECKRYAPSNKVSVDVPQRLLGVVVGQASTNGLVVTTSDFSADARRFARDNSPVLILKNGEQFVDLLREIRNDEGRIQRGLLI